MHGKFLLLYSDILSYLSLDTPMLGLRLFSRRGKRLRADHNKTYKI